MNDKKFNKYILLIIGLCVLLLMSAIIIYFIINDKDNSDLLVDNKPIENNEFKDLLSIGVDIYDKEKYIHFSTDESNMQYVTKGRLKELGYANIDMLVMDNCSDNNIVMYFDIYNVSNYISGYPIIPIYDCSIEVEN